MNKGMLVPETKPMYLSKTIWTALVMGILNAIVAFKPSLRQYLNIEIVNMLLGMLAMIFRMMGKKNLVLW